MSLAPCPACQRHIRVSERACPFCGNGVSPSIASKVVPGTTQRLSRAAAFAFTATLTLAGCSDTTTPAPDAAGDTVSPSDTVTPSDTPTTDTTPSDVTADAPQDNGGPAPAYGAPFDAPPPTDATAPDSGPGDGGIAPLYGAPVDATPFDSGPGDGGIAPLYGAPVDASQPDSGPRDGGGVVPLYGALPPPDAGSDAGDGAIGVRYGAVPPPDSGA